jgi:hypothetical protein
MCYVISCIFLFEMGMNESLEKILTRGKWKWKLESRISSLMLSIVFTLQFSFVWNLDVLEVFPMFILIFFLEWFILIWEREHCSNTSNQISLGSYYYLKDLKKMYYNRHELPYGKENQTLLIDDKPSKALQNSKWNRIFLNH